MENRIVTAEEKDKEEILALYRSFIHGAADWTEDYPNMDTINFDLERGCLFVMKNPSNEIIGAISIDQDEEVEALSCWSENLQPSAEFSRVCIRKDYQNQGLVKIMVRYVLDILKNNGNKSAHILVKTGHVVALSAYKSLGFTQIGTCHLFDKDFICMETQL